MITVDRLAGLLVHTALRPDTTDQTLNEGCSLAAAWNLHGMCVRPCDVADAARRLKGSSVLLSAAISFPHGSSETSIKVAEAQKAIDDGANEVLVAMNIGRLLSEKFEFDEQELRAIVMTAYRRGVAVKAVIDTCFMPERCKKIACRICDRAGVNAIVTATGYGTAGVIPADVSELAAYVPDRMRVDANGGVRTLDQVLELYSSGAAQIYTAFTRQILNEATERQHETRLVQVSAAQ